ncbi:putative Ig domain-containing protein [Candidatus Undinarchaeota archaeon]
MVSFGGKLVIVFLALLFSMSFAFANSPPFFVNLNDITTINEAPFSSSFRANDGDKDILTFTSSEPWVIIRKDDSDDGKANVDFYVDVYGDDLQVNNTPNDVTITVYDGVNPAVNKLIQITVPNTEENPVLESIPEFTVHVGQMFSYFINATDEDTILGDVLRFISNNAKIPINDITGEISFMPENDDVGAGNTISTRILVYDSVNLTDWQDVYFHYNKGPTIIDPNTGEEGIPDFNATEDVLFEYTLQATDPEGDLPFTFTHNSSIPFNIDNSGYLNFTPVQSDVGGPYPTVINVTDSEGSMAGYNFDIYVTGVNDPIELNINFSIVMNEDTNDTSENMFVYVWDEETDPVNMTWDVQDMNINATVESDGTLSLIPDPEFCGNETIIITVFDDWSPNPSSDSDTLDVEVLCLPDIPVWNPTPMDQIATEDEYFEYDANATDGDGDPITYGLNDTSVFNFDNNTGLISGTPTNTEVGVHYMNITATAGGDSIWQEFTITVNNTNDAPEWYPVPVNQIATEDVYFEYDLNATDPDGDTLTYGLNDTSLFSFNTSTGIINGTPINEDVGVYYLMANVTDGTDTTWANFTITVNNTNDPPEWNPTPTDQNATEDVYFEYDINATDLDGDTLTYWLNDTSVFSFDSSTGMINGTPGNDNTGIHYLNVSVSDLTATIWQEFTINVTSVNDAPEWDPVPTDQIATEDKYFEYDLNATDEENDTLIYGLNDTSVFSFDPNTGMINGTPTNAQVGVYYLMANVTDGTDTTWANFTITVNNTNDPPEWNPTPTDQNATEDVYFEYDVNATDPDGNTLTYWLNDTSVFSFNTSTGMINGTPDNDAVGVHYLNVSASDGTATIWQEFTITVNNTNDPPEWDPTPVNQTATQDVYFEYDVNATDPDGDTLTYWLNDTSVFSFNTSTGMINGTPTDSDVGVHYLNVSVTDGTEIIWQEFAITVNDVNYQPVWDPTPVDQNATESVYFEYDLNATDVEGDPLTYGLNDTSIFTFNETTGLISFTPGNSEVGVYYLMVNVTDGTSTEWAEFTITVLDVNNPPYWDPEPTNQNATQNVSLT